MSLIAQQIVNVFIATGFKIKQENRLSHMERKMMETWGNGDRKWTVGDCRICGRLLPIEPDEDETDEPETSGELPDAFTKLADQAVTVCRCCNGMVDEFYENSPIAGESDFRGDWEETCPRLFSRMVLGELDPHYVDEEAVRSVSRWRPSRGKGMILTGSSGCGKTFSLWLLKRALEQDKIRCDIYTAVEIARELSKHAKNLEAAVHLWNTRVLCIDDLGKEPITTTASALFWELIDRRYQSQSPTIITTRYVRPEHFAERFKEPTLGNDIRRRIMDTSEELHFRSRAEVEALEEAEV